jgi:parallel beta-helix repeat protein
LSVLASLLALALSASSGLVPAAIGGRDLVGVAAASTAGTKWSALAGTTVGSAHYAVPSGAVVVSPWGSDSAAGTSAAPLRTIGRAVSVAKSGATIVLRAGSYHESVTLPYGKRLTLQSWPGEAVWMDGSVPIADWVSSSGRWRHDGWTTEFDTSPTFTRGAPDHTQPSWAFINADYPLAAHPDQIFIDGYAQRQVGSLGEVVAGTFFHDRAANRLWLGSNPAGKQVRVSKLERALMVRSIGSVVRGIGVRRYAPSVPDMGAVTLETSGITAENVVIADSATTGLYVGGTSVVLRNLHLLRSGMLGMNGNRADSLVMERVLSEDNNVERFNPSPAAGGTKIAESANAKVRDSIFRDNYGTGLWLDVSSSNATFTGNEMRNNERHGIFLEISSGVTVANNFITQNGGYGIKVNNTSRVKIWNNTIVGNDRALNLVQDSRKPAVSKPSMTWRLGPVAVRNNVLANQRFGDCLLCVEDYTQTRTAKQIGVTANGNVYNRPNTSTPQWVVVWSKGPGHPAVFTTLAAFKTATGQEAVGHATDGPALVDANGHVISTMPPSSSAVALTSSVANAMGVPKNTRHHGALPR